MGLFLTIISVFMTCIVAINVIKEVIYSIFVANFSKSKHRRKKADKIHRSQSFLKRVTLNYVSAYITEYRKEYYVYRSILYLYVFYSVIAISILILLGCFLKLDYMFIFAWRILTLINCICVAFIIIIAKIGPDHRTKYDRF